MAAFAEVLQYAVNGVAFGAILVLAAIGLTLVYGVLNLANFAHGDMVALGAYGAFLFLVLTPLTASVPWALALAALLAIAGLAGPRVRRGGRPLLEKGEALACLGIALALATLALGSTAPLARGLRLPALLAAPALAAAAWALQARGAPPKLAMALAGLGLAVGLWALASPYLLATALAMALAAGVAAGFEMAVWRRLRRRKATVLTLLIVSIGVAFVLRNGLALQFGSEFLNFQRPLEPPLLLGGVVLTGDQLFTLGAAAVAVAGVHLFLTRSRTGKALRALADDADLARVSGIDVDRMVLVLWMVAAALAAFAGALLPLNNVAVNPGTGPLLVLIVFAAVILGGIGSPYGAMAGGLVIGLATELAAGLWRPDYKFAVGFAVLIGVLLLRPQGILGGKVA